MLDQNGVAILVAIVGVFSTIVGSLLTTLGNYISVNQSSKKEKKKTIESKIEEIYLLSNQISNWVKANLSSIYDEQGIKMYYIVHGTETECPVDRFNMLVCLYTPSIKKESLECISVVQHIKLINSAINSAENENAKNNFLYSYYYLATNRAKKENKYDKKEMENIAELYVTSRSDKKGVDESSKQRVELLVYLQHHFQEHLDKIQSILEKMS